MYVYSIPLIQEKKAILISSLETSKSFKISKRDKFQILEDINYGDKKGSFLTPFFENNETIFLKVSWSVYQS